MSSRRQSAVILGFLAVGAFCSGLAGAAAAPSGPLIRILDPAGSVLQWRPGELELRPAFAPIPGVEPGGPVDNLTSFAGGNRFLILTANPDSSGSWRKRREGLAVVFDGATETPRAITQIPLRGEGHAAAVSADGGRAYVLAHRSGRAGTPEGMSIWIHQLDLRRGRVTSTITLDAPATSIAVAPGGDRVFVSLPGRIQTCTTGPLVTSWFYRSPGRNRGLYFRPGGEALYALRGAEVAAFDPAAITARSEEDRVGRRDDATSVIALPFESSSLFIAEDGDISLVHGAGTLAFLDLSSERLVEIPVLPGIVREARAVRPLRFPSGGALKVGLFPLAIVTTIDRPETLPEPPRIAPAQPEPVVEPEATDPEPALEAPQVPPEATSPPTPLPGEISSTDPPIPSLSSDPPAAELEPIPPPEPDLDPDALPGPDPERARSPAPPEVPPGPTRRPIRPPVLSGIVSGRHDLAEAIVLYGPDSIIKEHARISPSPDGTWSLPLPPPGRYRLVPIGADSSPLRSTPNFHSVVIRRNGGGRSDLDFSVVESL
jgi:hypothetical protein